MNIFLQLAQQVDSLWQKQSYNIVAFTDIATHALEHFHYNWSLESLDSEIKNWLLTNKKIPEQMSLHNTFGQPSITVFNNNKFVVDLYFWVDFDTSIHSHGFRGAFRILHGESLQEIFHTKLLNQIAEDIRLVDLTQVDRLLLKSGAVQKIAPGTDLTHRVLHLAKPTVSLCVKTINEPYIKQWNYLPTGLAIQKQYLPASVFKQIYFYQYLLNVGDKKADSFLDEFLKQLNLSTQIHIYEAVANGTLDLNELSVDKITEKFVNLYEDSSWWAPYEKAHVDYDYYMSELEKLILTFKS